MTDALTEASLAEIARSDEAATRARYGRPRAREDVSGTGLFEASQQPRMPSLDEVLRTPSRMPKKGDKIRWMGDMANPEHDYEVVGVSGSRMTIKDVCGKGCKHQGEIRTSPAGLMSTPRWKYLGEAFHDQGIGEARQKGDFRVVFRYRHDRPENRGPSYGPVKKGSSVTERPAKFDNLARAKSFIKELANGAWDDPAGYVSSIELFSYREDPQKGLVRRFMGRTSRTRREGQDKPEFDEKMSMRGRSFWVQAPAHEDVEAIDGELAERKQPADYSRGAPGRSSELSWKKGPKPPKAVKVAAARGERRGKTAHINAQMRGEGREDPGMDINEERARQALDMVEEESPPGAGGRFEKLAKSISARGGARNPEAVAASIGRKKYGTKKMAKWAAKERRKGTPGAAT